MPAWVLIQNIVVPIFGMATGVAMMYGVFRIATHWIDARREVQLAKSTGGVGGAEIGALTARVEAFEATAVRVEELEERLDFTERILVRSRDQARLPESDR